MLQGKVALVTGATRGIGRGIARALAAHGATVAVNGRSSNMAAGVAREISAEFGVEAIEVPADQTQSDQIQRTYREVFSAFGCLDILVNNAGILDDGLLGMISERTIRQTFDVNVFAVIHNMQSAVRLMKRTGGGSIINLTSIIGVRGNVGQTVYGGSKAAVIGITKSASKELAPDGIRVNAIAPGLIDTDMTRSLPADRYDELFESIALGRIGTVEDVAGVALFLASDLSNYVT
ncbi:MAG: SDR family oxidoreductase, partial [Actinomycetia bacterium]|nr:SDR family oxidoreductase [Actinomycetes bacterium]